MKLRGARIKTLFTGAIMMLPIMFFALFFTFYENFNMAYAVAPASYRTAVTDKNGDWYSKPEYLDLQTLKRTVENWKRSDKFDFDSIESDPVIVAVMDTGINYEHEIFTGKYDANGNSRNEANYDVLLRREDGSLVAKNTVQRSDKDYSSVNFDVMDDDEATRHGTHVAGIVAVLIHELDLEKYIKIMPIKAAYPTKSGGSFSVNAVKDGIEFALANGADVVNMSFAGSRAYNLVSADLAQKAVFVAAAGNGGSSKTGQDSKYSPSYPAAGSNVIGVMNYAALTDGGMALSTTSNYGTMYDICAPGTAIWSANGSTTDGYVTKNGTSMATPIVSFAAALLELKYRALSTLGADLKNPADIANMVKKAYTAKIKKGTYEFPALDINRLALGSGEQDAVVSIGEGESLEMTYGRVKPLHFTFLPLSDLMPNDNEIEWFADGVKMGNGATFEYLPSSVGETLVSAVWSYSTTQNGVTYTEQLERRALVKVNYLQVDADELKNMYVYAVDERGEVTDPLISGKKYMLRVTDLEYVDPGIAQSTVWKMNGNILSLGAELEFTPSKSGDITLSVVIGGREKLAVFTVVKDKFDSDNIIAYVSFAIGGAALLACAIVAICVGAKHRIKKKNVS